MVVFRAPEVMPLRSEGEKFRFQCIQCIYYRQCMSHIGTHRG